MERRQGCRRSTENGVTFHIDMTAAEADAADFHALVLPGGVVNADHLCVDKDAQALARSFFEQHKPVAAICHGPWLLIDAGVVRGRNLTSYRTLQTDLKNAGANWSDEEVVVDHGLVTSRIPRDLPAFNAKLLEEIAEGGHPKAPRQGNREARGTVASPARSGSSGTILSIPSSAALPRRSRHCRASSKNSSFSSCCISAGTRLSR